MPVLARYQPGKYGLNLPRLVTAMRRGRWMLERVRAVRREMVRAFVGFNWNEEGAREGQPVNLMALFVQIVSRRLVPDRLRYMLTTWERKYRPTVHAGEAWMNQEIDKMGLAKTMKRVVIDSLFSIGIAKVALATPADSAQQNWLPVAGEPFVENVDLDDLAVDAHARRDDAMSFIGHRFRVPLDTVRDSSLYSRARKNLSESMDQPFNLEGDERIGMLGRGYREMQTQEYVPHVDLWEIYLPRDRLVVTLADDWLGGAGVPSEAIDEGLRVQEFIGHERGPYAHLRMLDVPGNLMPKAPLQDLYDLHEDENMTVRKIERTVARIKENLLVQGGALEDGKRVQDADDGEIIRSDQPQAMQQVVWGGQALQTLMLCENLFRMRFNQQAGNLDTLGGIDPQAKTAHQEALLNQNAGAGLQDYQDAATAFLSDVGERLYWYFHHDPFRVMRAAYSVPGLKGFDYMREITPQMREQIPYEAVQVKVTPYSEVYNSPQQRLAAINQLIQQVYAPLAPLAAQQGINLDLQGYFDKAGRLLGEPELDDLFSIVNPPQVQGGSPGQGQAKPASTERNYVRESIPGRSQKSEQASLFSKLMGSHPGGNESKNGAVR